MVLVVLRSLYRKIMAARNKFTYSALQLMILCREIHHIRCSCEMLNLVLFVRSFFFSLLFYFFFFLFLHIYNSKIDTSLVLLAFQKKWRMWSDTKSYSSFLGTFVESYQGIKSVRMVFDAGARILFVAHCCIAAMQRVDIAENALGAGIGPCLIPTYAVK